MANLAMLDWAFLAVLVISLLIGVWRGLVFELLSLSAWFGAFVAAQIWGQEVALMLPMAGASESVRLGVGFMCVFMLAIFVGGMFAVLAKKLVAAVGLSPFDRALGAGFGLVRGILILMIAGVLVALTPLKVHVYWRESVGASVISNLLKGLQPILPKEFGKYLS
jgi:membrane protein required for colicin V production